jgi:hypothetical protein
MKELIQVRQEMPHLKKHSPVLSRKVPYILYFIKDRESWNGACIHCSEQHLAAGTRMGMTGLISQRRYEYG